MLVSSGASCNNEFFFTTTTHCQAVIMSLITLRSPGDVRHWRATELRALF